MMNTTGWKTNKSGGMTSVAGKVVSLDKMPEPLFCRGILMENPDKAMTELANREPARKIKITVQCRAGELKIIKTKKA